MNTQVHWYLLLWLSVVHQCYAITYAIDISCSGATSLDAAIEEVQSMANKAWTKLVHNDEHISYVYRLIFRTDNTDMDSKRRVIGTIFPMFDYRESCYG